MLAIRLLLHSYALRSSWIHCGPPRRGNTGLHDLFDLGGDWGLHTADFHGKVWRCGEAYIPRYSMSIYLHLGHFIGDCRQICNTWNIWDTLCKQCTLNYLCGKTHTYIWWSESLVYQRYPKSMIYSNGLHYTGFLTNPATAAADDSPRDFNVGMSGFHILTNEIPSTWHKNDRTKFRWYVALLHHHLAT